MILAGLIVLLVPFKLIDKDLIGIILLALSLLTIHISAICNGMKMYGKINFKHHAVRLLLSICIIILFILSK